MLVYKSSKSLQRKRKAHLTVIMQLRDYSTSRTTETTPGSPLVHTSSCLCSWHTSRRFYPNGEMKVTPLMWPQLVQKQLENILYHYFGDNWTSGNRNSNGSQRLSRIKEWMYSMKVSVKRRLWFISHTENNFAEILPSRHLNNHTGIALRMIACIGRTCTNQNRDHILCSYAPKFSYGYSNIICTPHSSTDI